MTAQLISHISFEGYLAQDQQSEAKLEYYSGTIVAQAGSTARHNLIITNIIGHLYPQLRQKGCRIYPSDMRVQAVDQQVYTYPDLSIVCGPPQYMEPNELTLLNPSVIIEILSPSTEARDRKEKLVYYRSIESLQDYILVAQDMPYIQHYTRQTSYLWLVHLHDSLENQIVLESIDMRLPIDAVYETIVF